MGNETVVTLKMDDRVIEARLPYSDCTGTELMGLFCALMVGQTFNPMTVKASLEETLETYTDES